MTRAGNQVVIELENTGWDSRVRVFRAGDEVDVSAVVTDRYVIVVDTTSTPEQALEVLRLFQPVLDNRRLLVVNTHADYDHAWGNAIFETPGGRYPAPIIASRATGRRLRSPEEYRYLAERQKHDPRFSSVRLVAPTIELGAGGSIDGGDLTAELIETPGHTIDHLSVWLPVPRLLLAGDAAEYPIPYCDQRSDIATFVTTIRQLKALNPTVVIPCHGGPTDSGLLDRNIAYFVRLDAITREAIVAGVIPGDWKQQVNVADTIGYSFEQAMLDLGIDPSTISEFYRNSHQLAIRSTIARVMTGSPAL